MVTVGAAVPMIFLAYQTSTSIPVPLETRALTYEFPWVSVIPLTSVDRFVATTTTRILPMTVLLFNVITVEASVDVPVFV